MRCERCGEGDAEFRVKLNSGIKGYAFEEHKACEDCKDTAVRSHEKAEVEKLEGLL